MLSARFEPAEPALTEPGPNPATGPNPANGPTAVQPAFGSRPKVPSAGDLELLHRTLAELCRSKMPLASALRCLGSDLQSRALRAELATMASDVESGVPFEQAYASRQHCFPPAYRALVDAGVAAGDLPGVLDEIAGHARAMADSRHRLRAALRQPLYSLIAIVVLAAVLIGLVRSPIDLAHDVARDFAPGRGSNWAWIDQHLHHLALGILALLVVVPLAIALVRRSIDGSRAPGFWFRLPLLGHLRLLADKAMLAGTLAMLARRRVPLAEMLDLGAAVIDDSVSRLALQDAAKRARAGTHMSQALAQSAVFPPSLLSLVAISDGSADAPRALADIARIYHDRLDRAIDRAGLLLRPAIDLVLGVVVALFAMAYLFPAMHLIKSSYLW